MRENNPGMQSPILGWDVGGANVKAVRIQADIGGAPPRWTATSVAQRMFSLWREPDKLSTILKEMAAGLGGDADVREMALTMTAELADCFATRQEGVIFVLDAFCSAFPGIDLQAYGVDGKFHSARQARDAPLAVAAANWMASATFVAREFSDAIFLDVGSTTTDIIPIVGGRVAAEGKTDTRRLVTGELVYTGAQRTPICAIVQSLPLGGRPCRVAAEHFAVAADAHLWLGRIDETAYTAETPDGRGRSRSEAGARLARMVCGDMGTLGPDDITAIAQHVADAQIRQIVNGISQVMRRLGEAAPTTAVLAGEGSFLGRTVAAECHLAIGEMAGTLGAAVARPGPAAAVACLLAEARTAARYDP